MNPAETNVVDEPKPTRTPLYLSAFLFPGAGQLFQRRWIPALLCSVSFAWCLAAVIVQTAGLIIANMQAATAFMDSEPDRPFMTLSPVCIVAPLVVAILVYVVGLYDTFSAYRRQRSSWAERRLERKLQQTS